MGGASKNRKIRDRVDSEGKYGRWKRQIIGCLQVCLVQKSSRQQVGSPTSHLIHESHVISHTGWLTQKSSLLHVSFAYKSFRLWVNSPTSPLAHRFLRPQLISSTGQFHLQVISPAGWFAHKSFHLRVSFAYKLSFRRVSSRRNQFAYNVSFATSHTVYGSLFHSFSAYAQRDC